MIKEPAPAPSTCPRCATNVLAACTDERIKRAIAILDDAGEHVRQRRPIGEELYWNAMNLALEFPGYDTTAGTELAIDAAHDIMMVKTSSADFAAASLFATLTHDLDHLRTRDMVRNLPARVRTYTHTQYRRDATQIALAAHAMPAHRMPMLLNLTPSPIAEHRRDAGKQTPSEWIAHTVRTIGAEPAVWREMGTLS